MGRTSTPLSRALCIRISPAITRDSLFARASVFFNSIAASAGVRPAAPEMASSTQSAFEVAIISQTPCSPPYTLMSVSESRARRSRADASSAIAQARGRISLACASVRSTFRFAESADILIFFFFARSIVWVPIEPVEPSKIISLFFVISS